LSILCLFMVSSASLAGYTHALIFGLDMSWVTPAHEQVIQYSILGCLAMVGGLALAWFTRRRGTAADSERGILARTRWINTTFGWFLFGVGSVATMCESALHFVATIGTAVSSLANITTVGLLVTLASGMKQRRFGALMAMLVIYVPIMMMRAFATGHTPAKVSLLIPALCVVAGYRQFTWKSTVVVGICGFVFLSIMSGWLKTRDIIRSGHLQGMSYRHQVLRFMPAWFDATWDSALDIEAANETIRLRVDMTDILAMQVRYQPRIEPYARGQTVLDAGVAMVPRILWPRKPVIAGGWAYVAKYTGMVRSNPNDYTSIGLPYQFELYANAGPICVVIGLFVVGYVCGRLERDLFAPTTSLAWLLTRISITMTLCDGGQRADVVLPSLVAGGLTYLVLGIFVQSAFPEFSAKAMGRRQRTVPTERLGNMQPKLHGLERPL
jgi:hypothetical protein